MIEHASEFGASAAIPLTPDDTTHLSAGGMLRRAREAHGLHLEAVAAALKVPPQKLEALEADNIDALPDPVFARALAAGVCRVLRIDPAPVLAKLPGALRDGLAQADRTMSGNIRSHAERRGRGGLDLSRPLLVMVSVLLAGAAVLYWMPQSAFERIGAVFSGWTTRDAPNGAAPAAGESAAVPAAAPGTVVEPAAPGAMATTPAPASAAVPAAPPAPPAIVSGDLVSFSAREDAWITVTEAGGKVLLKRTVKAGETVALSGALPLAVVVGRAASVDVRVRGKPFELAPLIKSGGIARFEVK